SARNWERWPEMPEYVWPNAYVGGSYASEVGYLKQWVRDRAAWIDSNIEALRPLDAVPAPGGSGRSLELADVHPNPAASEVAFALVVGVVQAVRVEVYDASGRRLLVVAD